MNKQEIIEKYGIDRYELYMQKQKQYREEHKNDPDYKRRRKDIQKRYREKNADKIIEYASDPKNREKAKLRAKKWYESHKEYAIKRSSDYINSNPEVKKRSQSNYRKNHKEKIRVYNNSMNGRAVRQAIAYKRSDHKCNRGESTITYDYILNNIYTQPCFYCGETDWTKLGCDRIDNTLPHTPDNCVCSCYKCNTKRGKQDFKTFCEKIGVDIMK